MKPKMSKRVLAALLVTVMVLATLPLAVVAESLAMITNKVLFYKWPNTSENWSYDHYGKKPVYLKYGTVVTLEGYSGNWARIKFGAYIGAVPKYCIEELDSGAVTPSDAPNLSGGSSSGTTSSGSIEAQLLNEVPLYGKEPGSAKNYMVFGKVPAGSIVTVLKVNKEKDWARVLYHGHEGYIQGRMNLLATGDKKPAVQQPTSPSEPNTAPNTSPNTSTMPPVKEEDRWKSVDENKGLPCWTKVEAQVWTKPDEDTQNYKLSAGQFVRVVKTSGQWAAIIFHDAQGNYYQGYTKTKWLSKDSLQGSPDGTLAYDPKKVVPCIIKEDKTLVFPEANPYANEIATLASGTKVQAVQVKNKWAAILFDDNGSQKLGYVRSEYISKATKGSVLENWTDMNKIFKTGLKATIVDVQTGKRFEVKRVNTNGSHADVQPLTQSDTNTLNAIYAGNRSKWDRRSCWVVIDGVYYAASMVGQIHGDKNVICIHFVGSKTHESDKVDAQHQAAIQKAYETPIK